MLGGVDYIMYDVLLQLPILIVRYCSKIVFDFIRETLLIVQNRKRVGIFLGSDLTKLQIQQQDSQIFICYKK